MCSRGGDYSFFSITRKSLCYRVLNFEYLVSRLELIHNAN